ncbi:MAG: hypothetical protein M3384_09860 [Acidobacteriota bacterium]|nr:hypothetical protein [Acidobacteriota bacterium]
MKRTIFIICLILTAAVAVARAQDINDADKRGFDDLSPIKIDVDGDRQPDTIQPRTFKTTPRRVKGKRPGKSDVKHWIAFDLTTSKGLRIPAFFKYNYGTDESVYWVYVLSSAGDVDKDGKTDLVFYAGDDTSDETIILANRTNRFVVIKRKTADADDWLRNLKSGGSSGNP